MPNPQIPSRSTVNRVSLKAQKIRLEIDKLYTELGGASLWQQLSPLAHSSELADDERGAVFNLTRAMECLKKADEEVYGTSIFLRDILRLPHLSDALWGSIPSRFATPRPR